jgi:hypothetical protein
MGLCYCICLGINRVNVTLKVQTENASEIMAVFTSAYNFNMVIYSELYVLL